MMARRLTLTAVGTIVALAGFEHGLGELLQGPVSPPGMMIRSWPDSPFYRSLQGEPAMTLVPNLAVSGILTMALSFALLLWVIRFVDRKQSALVISSLSVALLLVGGGFGPPVLGLIVAAATLKVRSSLPWWRRSSGRPLNRLLASVWPGLLIVCVAAWIMALVGIAAFDYFVGIESVALTLAVLLLAFVMLPLTFASSFARDAAGLTSASR